MFHLKDYPDKQKAILTSGQYISWAGWTENPSNINKVVEDYVEHTVDRLKNAMTSTQDITFNRDTLNYYLENGNEYIKATVKNCQNDFADYGIIACTLDGQASEEDKDNKKYREVRERMNQKRISICNNSLVYTNLINKLAEQEHKALFLDSDIERWSKSDIGNAILQYCIEQIEDLAKQSY
ncbi:MAG: hypothetical protein N4R38_00265 [Lactobacillus crispatus]|nr:hypothetical protein [Lactobacillus crispatus]